jgi:predicted HTH domain antitoxin
VAASCRQDLSALISLGSAAQITGVDPGEFEQALVRAEAQRYSEDDEGWIDDWDPRVA